MFILGNYRSNEYIGYVEDIIGTSMIFTNEKHFLKGFSLRRNQLEIFCDRGSNFSRIYRWIPLGSHRTEMQRSPQLSRPQLYCVKACLFGDRLSKKI